jgi:hypothetical protein
MTMKTSRRAREYEAGDPYASGVGRGFGFPETGFGAAPGEPEDH